MRRAPRRMSSAIPGTTGRPKQRPASRIQRLSAITMPWSSSRGSSWSATGHSRRATSGAACTGITRAFRNPTRTDAPSRTSAEPSMPRSRCSAATADALYGRLATDRPHQVKAQFIYTAPFGVNVGVFQSIASGLPVSRYAVLLPGHQPVFYAGRGSEGRTPALSQTDVSVQYVLPLGGNKRLTVGLNVLNLFNQAQGVSQVQPRKRPGRPGRHQAGRLLRRSRRRRRGIRRAAPARPTIPSVRVLPGAHQGSRRRSVQFLGSGRRPHQPMSAGAEIGGEAGIRARSRRASARRGAPGDLPHQPSSRERNWR